MKNLFDLQLQFSVQLQLCCAIFYLLASWSSNCLGEELPTPKFEPQLIGKLEKGYGLSTEDVNGDGKRFVLADRLDEQGVMSCQSLQIADMNNDGRLDLIAAGWTSENLIVYWNRTKKIVSRNRKK